MLRELHTCGNTVAADQIGENKAVPRDALARLDRNCLLEHRPRIGEGVELPILSAGSQGAG